MTPLLFAGCFMFVAVLLLIGVIYSRVHWIAKATLVCASLLFSWFFYWGYVGSLGFPAPIDPPPKFRFIYAVVREPFPVTHDPGAVYIWMIVTGTDLPRSMALPFSTENRRKANEANRRVMNGEIVYMGRTGNGDDRPKLPSAGQSSTSQHKSISGVDDRHYDVRDEDADLEFKPPPDNLPKKE